jgi:choloylglycine hydrolase
MDNAIILFFIYKEKAVKKIKPFLFATLLASFIVVNTPLLACTDIVVAAKDGAQIVARSMEFDVPLGSNLRSSTQNRNFSSITPDGKSGLAWNAKYGYVYLDGMGQNTVIDGMNEKGLSIEALYLPGETQYQAVRLGYEAHAIPYTYFADWVLGNFQSVDEIRQALPTVNVFAQKIPGMGDMIFPLHFAIHDATGKGIVVEFVGGKTNVYNNKLGVVTNSPIYSWQLTNLRNYLNLSPYTPVPVTLNGATFAATGQGAGMVGLPGDVSPPSRFVKMVIYLKTALQTQDAAGALNLAQHIINNVDIPLGTVRAKGQNGIIQYEITQWVVFKDLTNKVFYYKTYNDPTLHAVSLAKIDFSSKATMLKMPINGNATIIDVTSKFRSQKEST